MMKKMGARFILPAIAAAVFAPSGCDTFTLTVTFVVPQRAESSETQTLALPSGARVVVDNDNGSTRIDVDPNATEARIEITRLALGETQAEADALLAMIVVTVTAPTPEDNTLRISAPRPTEASGNTGNFEASLIDDELNITAIIGGSRVSLVRLRITLPPGHGVDVTQRNGGVRASDLDTESTFNTDNGSIRVIDAAATMTIRADNGSVDVEGHRGTLDVRTDNGAVEFELRSLTIDQRVIVRTGNGRIEAHLPPAIDAELSATTQNGLVNFDIRDFDLVQNASATLRRVTATLNDGGPPIDLEVDNGRIDIDAR